MDPHPEIVTVRDDKDYIRVLVYSYHTTITGWGVLLSFIGFRAQGLGVLDDSGYNLYYGYPKP